MYLQLLGFKVQTHKLIKHTLKLLGFNVLFSEREGERVIKELGSARLPVNNLPPKPPHHN